MCEFVRIKASMACASTPSCSASGSRIYVGSRPQSAHQPLKLGEILLAGLKE
jgi:hypothetical protein